MTSDVSSSHRTQRTAQLPLSLSLSLYLTTVPVFGKVSTFDANRIKPTSSGKNTCHIRRSAEWRGFPFGESWSGTSTHALLCDVDLLLPARKIIGATKIHTEVHAIVQENNATSAIKRIWRRGVNKHRPRKRNKNVKIFPMFTISPTHPDDSSLRFCVYLTSRKFRRQTIPNKAKVSIHVLDSEQYVRINKLPLNCGVFFPRKHEQQKIMSNFLTDPTVLTRPELCQNIGLAQM